MWSVLRKRNVQTIARRLLTTKINIGTGFCWVEIM